MIFFGDIKPVGWLKKRMENYMQGHIGELDKIIPHLITAHNIYGKDRISLNTTSTGLGGIKDEGTKDDFSMQYYWWNSETQSNWKDGFCRSAWLLDNAEWHEKAKVLCSDLIETQDDDGYIGIYDPSLRFDCKGENGELWAQATALRFLLGCYESTQSENLFNAIIRAAQRIMEGYPKGSSYPFIVKDGFAGHSHGLAITDVFYRLYELTDDIDYLQYCLWLYEDYSAGMVSEQDLQYKNVIDENYILKGHGVHTYEHIRALAIAASQRPQYRAALNTFLAQLKYYITPSGAPIGDEWIDKRTANATHTGYEYCSVHELFSTYMLLIKLTNNIHLADDAEWLFYNASFGMQHPTHHSTMYCKTDNCYEANERRHPDSSQFNTRYKYSPTHEDAAVCCVPNTARTMPIFVENMFHENSNGFVALLYGPCEFYSEYSDVPVKITQVTNYPHNLSIHFLIESTSSVQFSLSFRFPLWAKMMIIDGVSYTQRDAQDSLITLTKIWQNHDTVDIEFVVDIQFNTDFCGDIYISRGPVLYALEIEGNAITKQSLLNGRYSEIGYTPSHREHESLRFSYEDSTSFTYSTTPDGFGYIEGYFYSDKVKTFRKLVPFGQTILCKVTFANTDN
ncbi:glycosyl hydrolase [Salmonella enterica subsp. enterica]|nr:glycosyl hydrolase [Salmonella enterica subsp. enterica]